MTKILWAQMRWPEIKETLDQDPIVIIPVGAMEEHGPALPVSVDTADVEAIAYGAAKQLVGKIRVLVTPTVWMGYSPEFMDYPGTITLDYQTLSDVVFQVCGSILKHGFKRILILNGHGGNESIMAWTVARLYQAYNIVVPCITHWYLIMNEPLSFEILEGRPAFGDHPGEYEHSISMALNPNLVSLDDIKSYRGKPKSRFLASGQAIIYQPIGIMSLRGGHGSNELASKEKGERLLGFTIEKLVEFLEDFIGWNVEDVYSLFTPDE